MQPASLCISARTAGTGSAHTDEGRQGGSCSRPNCVGDGQGPQGKSCSEEYKRNGVRDKNHDAGQHVLEAVRQPGNVNGAGPSNTSPQRLAHKKISYRMQVAPQTPHRMQDDNRIIPLRVTGGIVVDAAVAMLAAATVARRVPAWISFSRDSTHAMFSERLMAPTCPFPGATHMGVCHHCRGQSRLPRSAYDKQIQTNTCQAQF